MRYKLGLIILSALLVSLAFHPLGLHFFAWFGLIPLLFAIDGVKLPTAFKSGLLFGFCFSLFSLFWLIFLQVEINIKILLLFGIVILFLYFGLYFGVGMLVANLIGLWSLPFIIAGLEYLIGLGELGFPWLSFGYTQARYPIIIQQASVYGVYGISFWLVLVNVALYSFINNRNIKSLAITLLIFMLPLIYGGLRMKKPDGKFISVGIVQPNIDPNLKFTSTMRNETFNRLIYLSQMCARDSVDLIIWPETATPIFLKSPGKYQQTVFKLSKSANILIFTGTPIYNRKRHEIYNGAVLIEPEKGIGQEYRKLHLVPFGEHIPFDRYIPLLKKIDLGQGDYSSGSEYTIFKTKNFKFSCLICFESIFPELSREFVNRGANFLVNITNDGWFGKISGPQQHNDMAILRTVENGVPLLRSANTGISMVVDQYGRILKETKLFETTFLTARISIKNNKTIYQKIGDILPILSLIIMTVLVGLKLSIRKIY